MSGNFWECLLVFGSTMVVFGRFMIVMCSAYNFYFAGSGLLVFGSVMVVLGSGMVVAW